jgi:glutathione S-transferase
MSITNLQREQKVVVDNTLLNAGEESHYRLWCDSNSPYSCKLRTYLNYKEIPYKRQRINLQAYYTDIPAKVGMPIMPVLLAPDDTVLQDTTPIMELLEQENSHNNCIPDSENLAFLMWLLEDFGDEYLTRFSMHYRWGNDQSKNTLSHRLARSMSYGMDDMHASQIAPMIADRQTGFDEPLGLSREDARESLDQQLIDFLSILDKHFETYQFLLGNRPSIADFAIYGHLMAHLYQDPMSAEIMETKGSRVCNWLDTITEFGDLRGSIGQTQFGEWISLEENIPETLKELLSFVGKTYIPFACGVAKASANNEKWFTVNIYGLQLRFRTFQYRAWSFENVQNKFLAMKNTELISQLLTKTNIQPLMMENGVLHCDLFDGFTPPVVVGGIADAKTKYLKHKQAQRGQEDA